MNHRSLFFVLLSICYCLISFKSKEIVFNYLFDFISSEIEVESEDETVYQSKRTSQVKREQHSSLPDLSESHSNASSTYDTGNKPNQIKPSISTSSVSTMSSAILSPRSPNPIISKQKSRKRLNRRINCSMGFFVF